MMTSVSRGPVRWVFAPWLVAVLLMVSGCESSSVDDLMQVMRDDGGKTVTPKASQKAPAPAPTYPPSSSNAQDRKSPSLVPFLTRPYTADPAASSVVPAPVQRPPLAEGVVRIGVLLPLSGRGARLGQSMLNAAQLAMFSFAGDGFELLPQDTQGDAVGAEAAAATAVADGATLLLGPLFAPSVRAVRAQAKVANVPVLAFSSDRTVAGDGVYTLGLLPEDQIRAVAEHALAKGISRFAALVPDNAYGETVVAGLKNTVEPSGGVIDRVALFDPNAEDFTDVIRELADYDERRKTLLDQIKELDGKEDEISQLALKRLEKLQTLGEVPYEALLIAAGGKQLQSIAAHLPFFDIDPKKVRMLGTGLWDAPGLGAEPALVGGWFAAPPPKERATFEAQYKEVYGRKPERLATLAYDATALAAVLAQAPGGADFTFQALTQSGGFAGRDGLFRITPTGVTQRGLAVLEIRPRGTRVVRRAPQTFSRQTN